MRKIPNEELNRITPEEFKKAEKLPVVLVLDDIRSMNNIGSVFRTADAFRISAIYLCGITAQPPHRDIHRSALGATDSVEWKYLSTTVEAVEELRNDGYMIYAIEQAEGNISLEDLVLEDSRAKYALIFGNEVTGVDEKVMKLVDGSIEIPQFGTKHSLNIAVSAGVVAWHFFLLLKAKLK